ncbi:MAG: cation-translocating P-type ATPase [Candidatus Woesearchaeota archaeon]
MKYSYDTSWHNIKDIEHCLETSLTNGLDESQVTNRQQQFGQNQITPKKPVNPFILFLNQFNQYLVYILLIASIITFVMGHIVDSIVIFLVVLINSIIGFVQEYKAISAVHSLSKTLHSKAKVIRRGKVHEVFTQELTIGDIVILEAGSKVPADVRIIENHELRINESQLTGESVPASKETGVLDEQAVLGDRKNMAFYQTVVTSGRGKGIVCAIGDNTEMGKINDLIAHAQNLETPLTLKIKEFSKLLMVVILIISMIIFSIGIFIRGEDALTMFLVAVALAVALIPEGVPAAITITLAIGVHRMAKKNAIITKLPAVETLGSTQIICSDKTGTLTQNKMTVQKLYDAQGEEFSVNVDIYNKNSEISQKCREMIIAGVMCNDAHLHHKNENTAIGDPTEGALLLVAQKYRVDIDFELSHNPRVFSIPFESKYKYMATLHKSGDMFVKGAAEIIASRCSNVNHTKLHEVAEEFAKEGLRVLGFARKKIHNAHEHNKITHNDINDLEFLGFQAMIDPPREEVTHSIQNCYTAQIQVKMITGDHKLTAMAIAEKIGIKDSHKAMTGIEIEEIGDEELEQVAREHNVFARVSPEDKLRLVKILQDKHTVVAMTGDGVNDAPSLKQANIGVAMGLSGTDVAKESADMVLLDDNFSTIEGAVQEGRGVYDNLVKFLTWTLPTNLAEGLIIILAVLIGSVLPIEPLQLLWINMATAIFLGLMLAFEPKEKGIMNKPPHDSNASFFTPSLLLRIVLVGVILSIFSYILFIYTLSLGYSLEVARTVAINMLVFGELFYLFNCRSLSTPLVKINFFSNKLLFGGVSLMIIAQLLFTYTPIMNLLFSTAPIDLWHWGMILIGSLVVLIIIELEKLFAKTQVFKSIFYQEFK